MANSGIDSVLAVRPVWRRIAWPRIDGARVWQNLIFVVVAVAVMTPLGFLLLGSFSLNDLPTQFAWDKLGFENHVAVWTDPATYRTFYNTAIFVTIATAFGLGLASLMAWLVERTTMPGKLWVYAGIPMILATPGIVQAMSWVLLFSPQAGFVNHWLMDLFGLEKAPLNAYTLVGISLAEGLRLVPTAFLMLVPLLRAMDPTLEEAAATSGASPSSALRKVTLPLMLPGLVAVMIYQAIVALETFEVPGILGLPANIHVFATRIYMRLETAFVTPAYGEINSLAIMYLVIGLAAAGLYWNVIRRSERFTVITGKGYRPRQINIGRWNRWALGFCLLVIFASVGLPFLTMLYVSLLPLVKPPSFAVIQEFTFKNYAHIFTYSRFGLVLWNTVVMVFFAATGVTVLSFLISMVVVRSKYLGRRTLDMLAFIPHIIPGIVLALAFLWVFLIFGVFGGVWTATVAFIVLFIAYGTRSMNAAIMQIHQDLEEVAKVSGASPFRVMRRIFLPLMMPTFIGVWIWVVLLTVRLAGVPLLLTQGPRNQVLATLIWEMWSDAQIEAVGAIAVMLILVLFGLVVIIRWLGFGGGLVQQQR